MTRLISRANRMHTGVDRVELAYLQALIFTETPLFCLSRTAFGYVLLDKAGARALLGVIEAETWDTPSGLAWLAFRASHSQKAAETTLRRLALDRCRPRNLTAMLKRHVPGGFAYLNVGHSNLTDRVLQSVRACPDARIAILLHDTIPLDLPEMQRPESTARFERIFERAGDFADVIICNSQHTKQSVAHHGRTWSRMPDLIFAPLGVTLAPPEPAPVPDTPYFITIGTIEPRKNHALLLDIWDRLASDPALPVVPELVICGRRGWKNEAVFARLDARPSGVTELGDLTDGQVATMVQGSLGLLFPSIAEGYGLPPIEAAVLGVPVVCSDLPAYRETLADIPIYLNGNDSYLWRRTIIDLAKQGRAEQTAGRRNTTPFKAPDWSQHFNVVLRVT